MKITIVGGGNIGTQFAVHCAEKKHDVTVYTSAPDLFSDMLSTVDELGNVTHEGRIACATKDPEKAFAEADYIIITLPSTMMDSIAETIYQYSSKEAVIGVVPGNGGSECAFKRCIERGNAFFEIERVPAIARLVQKGKTVRSTGIEMNCTLPQFLPKTPVRSVTLSLRYLRFPADRSPIIST